MNKIVMGGAAAFMLLGISTGAMADGSGFGIGVKAGTLGAGAEITKSFTSSINGRLGLNSYTFATSGTESDIDYDIDLKWQSTAALIDWHPFQGSFRLIAGYFFNNNKIEMTGKPSAGGTYDLSGTPYTLDSLNGKVTFENGPYVGFGWGNAADGKGFGLSLEVGAVYQGAPSLSLTATGTGTSALGFADDLEAERKSAEDGMGEYKWYPQVALGISYAF